MPTFITYFSFNSSIIQLISIFTDKALTQDNSKKIDILFDCLRLLIDYISFYHNSSKKNLSTVTWHTLCIKSFSKLYTEIIMTKG